MTFDLEAAREIRDRLTSKDENVDQGYWAAVAAEMWPEVMAEIERLRMAARIKELEGLNGALMKHESSIRERAEKYRKRSQKVELRNKDLESHIQEQDDEIALLRTGYAVQVTRNAEYQRLGKTIADAEIPCLNLCGDCDECNPKTKAACDAIEDITKGKIGPDVCKPHSWQITDERRLVIKRLWGLLVTRYKYSYPDETEVLRAMLQEAEQE